MEKNEAIDQVIEKVYSNLLIVRSNIKYLTAPEDSWSYSKETARELMTVYKTQENSLVSFIDLLEEIKTE